MEARMGVLRHEIIARRRDWPCGAGHAQGRIG